MLGNYKLDEIHFHFGNSEHTFKNYDGNNLKFLMEIHLIHVKENFDNMAKALEDSSSDKDKIAILSVMVRNQNSDNTMIKNLVDALVDVKTENTSKTFTGVKLEDLLPRNTDGFYRYNGSLTYPSCKETVVWTVFKVLLLDKIKIFVLANGKKCLFNRLFQAIMEHDFHLSGFSGAIK